ncbi:MAG TPA: hypothetical protein VEQ59_09810, partial [Polyangiaceae bacterium]|nr:hypothetical protein [Polyangiaceae bacterium]
KRNSLHGAALSAAGARNAVDHDVSGLPRLSVEELLKIDPDVVLILAPGATLDQKRKLVQSLSALSPLRAVEKKRIGIVDGNQSVGPGILKLVDALSGVLKKLAEPPTALGFVE